MTREASSMSGITLITVPTIEYGGYFLLTSLMNKGSGYTENPLRQNFFRPGHAHAGVVVILSLFARYLGTERCFQTFGWFESGCRSRRFSFRRGSFSQCCPRPLLKPTERSR